MPQNRTAIGFYTLAIVCLVDQLTKWLVIDRMADVNQTIPVTKFLNFVLVWNKGVTFGIFNDAKPYMPYVLIAIAVIVLILLTRWLWRTSSGAVALALGFIMGGALGNVIDRFRYGAVVDFLDFYYRNYHWYAFNVADAAIFTGVALLLIDGMVRGK